MTVIETPNETAAALTTWDCCVRVVLLARLTEGVEWNTSGLESNMLGQHQLSHDLWMAEAPQRFTIRTKLVLLKLPSTACPNSETWKE